MHLNPCRKGRTLNLSQPIGCRVWKVLANHNKKPDSPIYVCSKNFLNKLSTLIWANNLSCKRKKKTTEFTANSNSFIQTLKSFTIQSSRKDKILQRKKKTCVYYSEDNSPCMQRGQSFFWVLLKRTYKNIQTISLTVKQLNRKLVLSETIFARWLHRCQRCF